MDRAPLLCLSTADTWTKYSQGGLERSKVRGPVLSIRAAKRGLWFARGGSAHNDGLFHTFIWRWMARTQDAMRQSDAKEKIVEITLYGVNLTGCSRGRTDSETSLRYQKDCSPVSISVTFHACARLQSAAHTHFLPHLMTTNQKLRNTVKHTRTL